MLDKYCLIELPILRTQQKTEEKKKQDKMLIYRKWIKTYGRNCLCYICKFLLMPPKVLWRISGLKFLIMGIQLFLNQLPSVDEKNITLSM